MAKTPLTGGCACEGVRYRIDADARSVTNCHCEPCRRITGHFDDASDCRRLADTIETIGGDRNLGVNDD